MSPSTRERRPAPPKHETELYPPIRDFLVSLGYTVRSEVRGCDIAATREEDELVVIEMKRRFSTDLLIQAVERQRLTDSVYVALPQSAIPTGRAGRARWQGMQRLLKRLELGLLLVSDENSVSVLLHPIVCERRRAGRARRALLREVAGRSGDYNVGGSTRQRICTAYREAALFIACCLERHGPMRPRDLRALGADARTQAILSKNYYGWFERIDRGVYALKPQGQAALAEYPELAARFRHALSEREAGHAGEGHLPSQSDA
jgi:hypothetical protein